VNIRHSTAEDFKGISYRNGDRTNQSLALLAQGSFTRTIEINDVPIAIFGMYVRWRGVADVWAIVSDEARGNGIALTKSALRLLKMFEQELSLRRIGANVIYDNYEYRRWLLTLKFEPEYILQKASPDGRDIMGYVRWTT